MARPTKSRRVCRYPDYWTFSSEEDSADESVALTLEEYESIRLIDLEGKTQGAVCVRHECREDYGHGNIRQCTPQTGRLSRERQAPCDLRRHLYSEHTDGNAGGDRQERKKCYENNSNI